MMLPSCNYGQSIELMIVACKSNDKPVYGVRYLLKRQELQSHQTDVMAKLMGLLFKCIAQGHSQKLRIRRFQNKRRRGPESSTFVGLGGESRGTGWYTHEPALPLATLHQIHLHFRHTATQVSYECPIFLTGVGTVIFNTF